MDSICDCSHAKGFDIAGYEGGDAGASGLVPVVPVPVVLVPVVLVPVVPYQAVSVVFS